MIRCKDQRETNAANSPEGRANQTLAALEKKAGKPNDLALLSDHLSLLRRWYYRPEKQRIGEIFLPNEDGVWPVRRILRGAARMVLGEPKPLPDVQREAAKAAAKMEKTRILHEGQEARPLVGEVQIERAVAEAGFARDVLRTGRVIAALDEQLARRALQLRQAFRLAPRRTVVRIDRSRGCVHARLSSGANFKSMCSPRRVE